MLPGLMLMLAGAAAAASGEEAAPEGAREKLQRLEARFNGLGAVSLRYRHSRPSTRSIATVDGGSVRAVEKVDGKLKMKGGAKMRFNAF